MKISRDWLQTFFDAPLPDSVALSHALTFHAFEIESVENDVLDVKVTPNRGHDCLSHRGIAKEVSAILNIPLKSDPLRSVVDLVPTTNNVLVSIDDSTLCPRYIAGYIRGVQVKPSPEWLRKALESLGQRSINNVVDATNYVMFNLGQPLHAFDAGQLLERDGVYSIRVRNARNGERMVALDGKEYTLQSSMLVIADARADSAIGIAGVKGGAPAAITEETSDIIIESANFDGVSVRRTASALKLRTDASSRFEQGISPDLARNGMHAVAALIRELAGGELVGFVDDYENRQGEKTARVSLTGINDALGTSFGTEDIAKIFERLDLPHIQTGNVFEVRVPPERLDLAIEEDLIEEVARIAGYDTVPSISLPSIETPVELNDEYAREEHMRSFFVTHGFSEVFTSVFTTKGDRVVLNKVDGVKPFLRKSLHDALAESVERNARNKDVLGISQVRLFEIGTVWVGGNEEVVMDIAVEKVKGQKTEDDFRTLYKEHMDSYEGARGYETLPGTNLKRYEPFSKYPFIVRDISMWVPSSTEPSAVRDTIKRAAGELAVRIDLIDTYAKDDKTSLAFRIVFQSFDTTLTDTEVAERMGSVNAAVTAGGYEIR